MTAAKVVSYLNSVFHGRHPPGEVGPRTTRELRHVAECLDAIGAGNLTMVADMLMQRFKALEQSVTDKNWNMARHLEVLPLQDVGLTTQGEQLAASRAELLRAKLEQARAKHGRS